MSYSRVSVPTSSTGVTQVFWPNRPVMPGLDAVAVDAAAMRGRPVEDRLALVGQVLFTVQGHCGGPIFLISSSSANRPGKLAELTAR